MPNRRGTGVPWLGASTGQLMGQLFYIGDGPQAAGLVIGPATRDTSLAQDTSHDTRNTTADSLFASHRICQKSEPDLRLARDRGMRAIDVHSPTYGEIILGFLVWASTVPERPPTRAS